MLFELKEGTCGYHIGTPVLKDISFKVRSGEVLCVLGPNGTGKTTLFKSILRLIKLQSGVLEIDGEDTSKWNRQSLAQKVAYIPQAHNPPFPFTVLDVILMGRTAHLGALSSPAQKDVAIADQVIEDLNITYLRNKVYTEISGGEKQLVLIARALAQQPQMMVMDEPTAALDFGNQLLVLNQVEKLAQKGLAIIMASHFPDHAFLYSSQVILLKDRGIYAQGTPEEVVTEENLGHLYKVGVKIVDVGMKAGGDADRPIKVCIPVNEHISR